MYIFAIIGESLFAGLLKFTEDSKYDLKNGFILK